MNTRTRSKGSYGLPPPKGIPNSEPSSSSADSSDDSDMDVDDSKAEVTLQQAKDTAASLEVLQLSDEDEGPRIGTPINTSAEDDLDSIDSKLLFRSSPPPIPSTSRAAIPGPSGLSGSRHTVATRKVTVSSGRKAGSSTAHMIPPMGARKDIRKQFSTLIEKCQEFEEQEGFDRTMENVMSSNIGEGQQLFDEIGSGPGDMFLAFLHTRICSGMLKYKTVNIGSNTSAFKVDLFLNSLMEKCLTSDGEYVPRQAVKCISSSATDCCKSLNPMMTMVGAFERGSIYATEVKEKEKKPRMTAKKRQLEETIVSQTAHHEVKKLTSTDRRPNQKTNMESFSKEILEVLKLNCKRSADRCINIFEFTLDKNSFANTIESLFFVAFLVRDGEINFFREDNQANHDYTISIKPDVPPDMSMRQDEIGKKKKRPRESSERSQFILSFSARKWKELRAFSSGEDIITEHKKRLNEEEDGEST